MAAALAAGFGLGFVVAAQVGPISLLCMRSVLRGRFVVGVAIGAGAAVIDALYAGLGVAGASALLEVGAVRLTLGIVGACVLAAIGLKTLHSAFRVRLGGESDEEVASPRRAFLTSLGATASNPLTIASWAAIFAAATTAGATGATTAGSTGGTAGSIAAAGSTTTAEATALLLTGIGLGSLTWMCLLTAGVSLARRGIGARFIRAVDVVAGTGLLAFGGLLAARTLHDD
jgi:putative LysE/RhtB family amino acid efflux pump